MVVQFVKQFLPEADKNKSFAHRIHVVELVH